MVLGAQTGQSAPTEPPQTPKQDMPLGELWPPESAALLAAGTFPMGLPDGAVRRRLVGRGPVMLSGASDGADVVVGVDVSALRAKLKGIATALRLDSGHAVEMVDEAVTLCAPVLSYVALGDC